MKTISRRQRTYESAARMRECVRLKGASVLTMIGEKEFRAGLARLDRYLAGHPGDPWLVCDRISMTVGVKRGRR